MPREIDSLIERGLTLYGQGDLEDAMVAWEQALAIEPDHPQARSYLEYTRANYEVLAAQSTRATSQGAPFGIADDEPEYQIEIQPGEIKPGTPKRARSVEEGWPISADPQHNGTRDADLPGRPLQEMTMEADEPPSDATQPDGPRAQVREDFPPRAKRTSEAGMEFDDATREYDKQPQARTEEFGPDRTPGFGQAHDFQTPPGFSSQ
ncbi:MAG TPA: tetratricopeptide repeat protein, partial [Kofleriaceae bacterium]|nr:tetratricopeptide repeat protein [Kofleriaceae bacterium]